MLGEGLETCQCNAPPFSALCVTLPPPPWCACARLCRVALRLAADLADAGPKPSEEQLAMAALNFWPVPPAAGDGGASSLGRLAGSFSGSSRGGGGGDHMSGFEYFQQHYGNRTHRIRSV